MENFRYFRYFFLGGIVQSTHSCHISSTGDKLSSSAFPARDRSETVLTPYRYLLTRQDNSQTLRVSFLFKKGFGYHVKRE